MVCNALAVDPEVRTSCGRPALPGPGAPAAPSCEPCRVHASAPLRPDDSLGWMELFSESQALLLVSAAPVLAHLPPLSPPPTPTLMLQLRPEAVTRQLRVDGSALVLDFAAVDMRTLRAAVGTFCDLLGLATRTLEAFGPAATVAAAAPAQ